MNEKIEKKLKKLGSLLHETAQTGISENDLLAYLEKRLDKPSRMEVEKVILASESLRAEIQILKTLITTKPQMDVPKQLHKRVLESIGLKQDYAMLLVLKKVHSVFEILKGANFFQPEMGLSLVPTRGEESGLYVFQSTMTSYLVSCRIQADPGRQLLHFSVEDQDGTAVKNGRFKVKQSGHPIFEIITDNTGTSPVEILPEGDYEIEFSIGRENLGILKLTIS